VKEREEGREGGREGGRERERERERERDGETDYFYLAKNSVDIGYREREAAARIAKSPVVRNSSTPTVNSPEYLFTAVRLKRRQLYSK